MADRSTGRPPVYEDPEELKKNVDDYIRQTLEKGERPLLTTCCRFLGFNSKDTFYAYGKKPGFSDPIKKARLFIEEGYESALFTKNCTGAIFGLKNFGWKDQQDLVHKTLDTEGEETGIGIKFE